MDTTPSKPIGRNDLCPCQSGKKYKQCCLDKDEATARQAREAAAREAREKAEAAAAAEASEPEAAPPKDKAAALRAKQHHGHGEFGHFTGRGNATSRGFQKPSGTRKVGGS